MNEELLRIIKEDEFSERIFDFIKRLPDEEYISSTKIFELGGFSDLNKSKQIKMRSRIVHLLKSFASLGYGKYVVGRHGKPTRLVLNKGHSIQSIIDDASPDEMVQMG